MKNSALHWLYQVPGRKKIYIVILTLVQCLHGFSGVLYALLLRSIVDSAVAKDSEGFWHNLILIILLVIAQLALRAIVRWLTELSRSSLENCFKERLVETLLKKDYAGISAVHSGEWLNRLTNDTMVVADSYVEILPGAAGMIVKLISALVMILVIEPRFAAILIPGGAALIFLTWLFRKVLKRLHKSIQEADGSLRIFLQERIGSMLMIRSFAAERQTMKTAEEKMSAHKAARMKRTRFSNVANIGFGAAMSGMYLLGVGWCGYGILKGTITFGTLTAVTQLIAQIQTPVANITGYLPKFYGMLASAERLMEAELFEEDPGQEAFDLPKILDFYQNRLVSFGLKDASFTYYQPVEKLSELNKDILPEAVRDISLEIQKGEYVAFTGISGCGKSTTLKLLMCVCKPDDGERYYIDTTGERNELTPAFRRLFAYVPQGNQLMSGTIREIVSFADPSAAQNDEKINQALEVACAKGFVSELEGGIDTILGERGTGLSEGQMQRIAIARAIFSGNPVLLLDEATSALDEKTEGELLTNLKTMTDHTVLIVTHRQKALTICDRQIKIVSGTN